MKIHYSEFFPVKFFVQYIQDPVYQDLLYGGFTVISKLQSQSLDCEANQALINPSVLGFTSKLL